MPSAELSPGSATAGEVVPSADTGAYSKARFPLTPESAQTLVEANRRRPPSPGEARATVVRATVVLAFDGTNILMSDTPANQTSYPQHSNSIGRVWLPVGQTGGVVLCNHGSGSGGCDGRIYQSVNGNCHGNCMPNCNRMMVLL